MVVKAKSIKIAVLCVFLGLLVGMSAKYIKGRGSQSTFSDTTNAVVVCDAGHGEPDGGAVGISGTLEKDINLSITKKVAEILESRNVAVIMTRETDNGIYDDDAETIRQKKVSDMHRRLDIVNSSNADLFLSIHMNSFTDKSVSGVHVFYNKDDESLKTAANKINNKIEEITGADSHEVKPTPDGIYLMQKSNVPAILVECGFLSNAQEEKLLQDEKYQSKMAWAIADSVVSFIEVYPSEYHIDHRFLQSYV